MDVGQIGVGGPPTHFLDDMTWCASQVEGHSASSPEEVAADFVWGYAVAVQVHFSCGRLDYVSDGL